MNFSNLTPLCKVVCVLVFLAPKSCESAEDGVKFTRGFYASAEYEIRWKRKIFEDASFGVKRIALIANYNSEDSLIFVSSSKDAMVQGLNSIACRVRIADGEVEWRAELDDLAVSNGVCGSNIIIVPCVNSIIAINANSGSIRWKIKRDRCYSGCKVFQERVFFLKNEKTQSCVRVEDGRELWSIEIANIDPLFTPQIVGNRIYLRVKNGMQWIYPLDGSGRYVSLEGGGNFLFATGDGKIITQSSDNKINCFDERNGRIWGSKDCDSPKNNLMEAIMYSDGEIAFITDESLHFISSIDGHLIRKYKLSDGIVNSGEMLMTSDAVIFSDSNYLKIVNRQSGISSSVKLPHMYADGICCRGPFLIVSSNHGMALCLTPSSKKTSPQEPDSTEK